MPFMIAYLPLEDKDGKKPEIFWGQYGFFQGIWYNKNNLSFWKGRIPMKLDTMTADEIRELNPDTAVLPIGSIEQHGPHLPVTTDFLIADAIGREIADRLNAFLIPTLPVSNCREHMGKKGSVWMDPDTFYRMFLDIMNSLKEQGFKKVVVYEGHGGIFTLTSAIRQTNATNNPDFMVYRINDHSTLGKLHETGILQEKNGIHANEYETSLMLYLHSELVKTDRIVDCVPDVPRAYFNYGSIFRYSPAGIWGEPSLATAEKGKIIFDTIIADAMHDIPEMFAFMENKEQFGYSKF